MYVFRNLETSKIPTIRLWVSVGLPIEAWFLPWRLEFRQYSFHLVSQSLRNPFDSIQPISIRFTKMLCSASGFPST